MKVSTKFDSGERVFFLHEKKVIQSVVRQIKVHIFADGKTEITYLCNNTEPDSQVNIKVCEQDAFKTKDELLKSL